MSKKHILLNISSWLAALLVASLTGGFFFIFLLEYIHQLYNFVVSTLSLPLRALETLETPDAFSDQVVVAGIVTGIIFGFSILPALLWSAIPELRGIKPRYLRYSFFAALTCAIGILSTFYLFIGTEGIIGHIRSISQWSPRSWVNVIGYALGGVTSGLVFCYGRRLHFRLADDKATG